MRVLLFGTYDDAVHPRARVLREGLEAHGVEVRDHNVGLGLSTADRVRMLEQPHRLYLLVARVLWCWARLLVRTVREPRPRPDLVVVGYLGHFDVLLARLLYPRTHIALDYLIAASDTARDRRRHGRVLLTVLDVLDRVACAAADTVIVDTSANVVTVPERHRHKTVVTPVGAPRHWFSRPPRTREPGPLRAIFFGLFTPLQGAPVLLEALRIVANRGRAIDATIIGTGQDYEAARSVAPDEGVTWKRWVAPERLPALVAEHDVCFGIFGDGPKGARVVPNKAYQGAAAGCLVVTSDTPVQRAALPRSTRFVPAGDAHALADVLCSLPDGQDLLPERHDSFEEATRLFDPAAAVTSLLTAVQSPTVRE